MDAIAPTVEVDLDEHVRQTNGRTFAMLGRNPIGCCTEPISEAWKVVYTFRLTNGTPQLSEMRVSPTDAEHASAAPPTAVEMRRVTPSRAARLVRAEMVRKIAELDSQIDGFGYWENEFGDPDALAATRAPRGNSDEHYLRFARLYAEKVAQGSKSPVVDVHADVNPSPNREVYSRAYVRDAITKARSPQVGLLTPTVQGRSGGELTEKALRLLNQ